ncbi:MAG: serine hydrolase [Candidatus Symbiothrix sp.]|jgi:beta-glucosidase-like glycosyl hydrolase/CubicO group peptidase (beta-lactamase class C family)|nr:serine hydrolase [Candidatus Symbiothrix sp.]
MIDFSTVRNKFFLFFLFFTPSTVFTQTQPHLYKNADKKAMNQWVDSVFTSLTMDEKIGQLFMLIVDPSPSWNPRVLKNIKEQRIGGICFSGGKLSEQANSLNLYQSESRIPLFVSADAEWGLAMRLKQDTPRFPKNMMLGAIQNNDLLRLYGEEIGRECREMGIQINFAPVVDINSNPVNPVIGMRSFGENRQDVLEKALAYSRGVEKMSVMTVAKHFPGHGDTSTDSHYTLPQIDHDRNRLDSIELFPFREFIRSGFSGVMTGHLSVPALDNTTQLPSSLSPVIVNRLLSDEMGFQGLKFTDALRMKGAITHRNACVESILAGNDVLLSPDNPNESLLAVKKAVEMGVISMQTIEEKCRKILCYKFITGLNRYRKIQTKGLSARINTSEADWLNQKLNEEAITLLKNTDELVPLKQLERKIAVVSLGAGADNSFQSTLKLYKSFDFFQADAGKIAEIIGKLNNYNVIICAVHSEKITDFIALQTLAKQKEVHLCFFASPYFLTQYKTSISSATSVILAYENTTYAQKAAAEVLMGGIAAKGKLPVTIDGLFLYGTGFSTEKVRLSYQHPREAGMSEFALSRIDGIVKEGIENKAFPGCQILVAKDGVVVYNRSFGFFDYAGTHPVKNSDLYDLASITKATATLSAVMNLYDTKKLKLGNPLSHYVPILKNTDKANITIQKALFHETGLEPFLPLYLELIDTTSYNGRLFSNKRDAVYRILYDKNTFIRSDFKFRADRVSSKPKEGIRKKIAENIYLSDQFDQIILQQIAELKVKKPNHYRYSDLNFMLLKEAVENISGQSLDVFVKRHFFDRLGASSTTFLPLKHFDKSVIAPTENDEFLRNQIIIGYPHDEAAAFMGGVSGNAGLFSNANDLAKLLQLYLNLGTYGSERFLSMNTVKLFTQTKSPNSRRGLGFDKPDKQKETGTTSEKAPGSVYGHTGYTGTCFWVDPDNQLIYIFLSNRVYPSRTHTQLMGLNIRPRIQDVIYEAIRQ